MKRSRVKQFMTMSEDKIIGMFKELPRSMVLPTPYGDAVYVKGHRDDAVLLVSHTDTVWGDSKIKISQDGPVLSSSCDKTGIGADDRAGIAALWALKDTGHSILIVPEEETGCKGSGYVSDHYKLFFDEQYAIQFDRRGGSDLVFYDCGNVDFENYLLEHYTQYDTAMGSFSDICTLCPALGIAGVNISIGFRNEHTSRETLNLDEWFRTVNKTRKLLSVYCPDFEYIESVYNYGYLGGSSFKTDSVFRDEDHGTGWLYEDERTVFCHGCQNTQILLKIEDCCPACGLGEEYLVDQADY